VADGVGEDVTAGECIEDGVNISPFSSQPVISTASRPPSASVGAVRMYRRATENAAAFQRPQVAPAAALEAGTVVCADISAVHVRPIIARRRLTSRSATAS
jgi:hypothetical protein